MAENNERITFYRHVFFAIIFAFIAADFFQSAFALLANDLFLNQEPYFEVVKVNQATNGADMLFKVFPGFSIIITCIKITMFFWLYFKLRPIYRLVCLKDISVRESAKKAFDNVYSIICFFFLTNTFTEISKFILRIIIVNGCFTLRENGINLVSFAFQTYYAVYFAIIYLDPILFTKIADKFYEGDEIYSKKDVRGVSIKVRIFSTILNLLIIPMLLIAGFALEIPDLNYEKLTNLPGMSELKNSLITVLKAKIYLIGVVIVSLVYSIGYIEMLYKSIQRPIDELIKKMERLASGDYEVKTTVLSADEIGNLKSNFNQMVAGLKERENLRETFGKYVSIEIARHLMNSEKINLGGEEINATILFSDIRNFTSMSEKMSAAEVVEMLNEYFAYITEPILENNGVINKFIGDAVMAIYTPHLGSKNHVEDSIKSAVGMRKKLEELNSKKKFPFEISFGVGIHTGPLVAGNIGTKSRLEYTVIGDTVNVASRIESENKTFKSDILISENVFEAIEPEFKKSFSFEKCSPVTVKGKEKPLMLYKIG